MAYCEKCGHLLDKSAQRCEVCGAECSPPEADRPAPSAKPGPPPPPAPRRTPVSPPVSRPATAGPPPPPVAKQSPPPVPRTTVPGSAGILPAPGPQASSLPPSPPQSTVVDPEAGKMPTAPVAQPPAPPQPPLPPPPTARPPVPPAPPPPTVQPPSARPLPPAAPPLAPAVPRSPSPAVSGTRSALLPVLIVGAAIVFLLVVALGGYFLVYPRLRAGDAPPPTASAELSSTPSGSPIPAADASSDSSAAPDSASEAESASREPVADGASETTAEAPSASAEETTSPGRQVTPAETGRSSAWSSRPKANQSKLADPRISPIPEPVSSPGASDPNQGRVESPAEPAAAEPVPDASDRSPSPAPEETEASQPLVDRQAPVRQNPAYEGPKRGVVIWTGEADKGMTVVIEGTSANVGQVQGALPGVACTVRLTAANVAVAEGPGPRNGYRRISLRFNKKGRFSVPVEWEVLH
jgi:hypothetical protein